MNAIKNDISDLVRKDLLSTFINNIIKIISGPLILFFIPTFLTSEEQGYWYTFTGLAALAVFADLGFSTIVLQFSAHEFAFCRFNDSGKVIIGDNEHLWKLASFFRFTIFWLCKIGVIVFPFIVIGGFLFLEGQESNATWKIPWIIYSGFSALLFFSTMILSFFEGCDSVAVTQKIRMKITAIMSVVMLSGLYFNLGLYSLSFSMLVASLTASFMIYFKFKNIIYQMWKLSEKYCYDWGKEFYALIWRYAISWCSGYFIFQLFTPLAFKFHSPEFAGKIGISIAMWTAGCNIASSWLTAVTPKINILISEKKWNTLNRIFSKSLTYSCLTMGLGMAGYFILYWCFYDKIKFFSRVLDIKSMIILALCWMMQVYINALAIYLRSHKREPMMPLSLFSAIFVPITTYFCAAFLSEEYLFLGFFMSYVYGIPITYYLYKKQKEEHLNN